MADSLLTLSNGFREKLLKRNLSYDGIDIGNVEAISGSNNQDNTSFTISNDKFYSDNMAYNRYCPRDEDRIPTQDEIIKYSCVNGTYHDFINQDSGKIKTLNMIGSFLSGKGVSLGNDGKLSANYDIKTSLIGNILSSTGVMYDTPLGMVANQELIKAVKNNILARTQSEVFGRINLDPISLLKGGDILQPDYSITIGYDGLSRFKETLGDLTGFQLPTPEISEAAQLNKPGYSKHLIKQTGKGQVQALFYNLSQNKRYGPRIKVFEDGKIYEKQVGYGPGYEDDRIKTIDISNDVSYTDVSKNFKGVPKGDYTYDEIDAHPSSLLGKTKALFEKSGDKMFITSQSRVVENEEGINPISIGGIHFMSGGNQMKTRDAIDGHITSDGNVFSRVFNKKNQYSKVKNLHKHTGLAYKDSSGLSVLDSNGFVKVSPYKSDSSKEKGSIRKYMFSIENLAWDGSDEYADLPEIEKGPGDVLTGSKGRIMWFPPYGLDFNDNSSVNIESTEFIGRGEPVYTYNNTERTGNLQFKVIIDYPSYMDDLKSVVTDDMLKSIIYGINGVNDISAINLSTNEKNDLDVAKPQTKQEIHDVGGPTPPSFEIHFDENDASFTWGADGGGEGNEFYNINYNHNLYKMLNADTSIVVTVTAYKSADEDNQIQDDRLNVFNLLLENNLKPYKAHKIKLVKGDGLFKPDATNPRENRIVALTFERDIVNAKENTNNVKPTEKVENPDFSNVFRRRLINEAMYFEKLHDESPLFFEEIKEKVKYFHPAFHSITPEGFTSRLNFLHQCTRQGPTKQNGKANNLVFGKPPVCILRLGDFYHSKIMIDNMSMTFDDSLWDLNPEGAGVQPRICTVDLSFKFLGGSSLRGPINKLQNAVSYNFFGNLEVFSDKAERIVPTEVDDKGNMQYKYASSKNNPEKLNEEEVKTNVVTPVTDPALDEKERSENAIDKPFIEDVEEGKFLNLDVTDVSFVDNTIYYAVFKKDLSVDYSEGLDLEIFYAYDSDVNIDKKSVGYVTINEDNINTVLSIEFTPESINDITEGSKHLILKYNGVQLCGYPQ